MRKKAFTLMEIIIVLVVVGILATVGFPIYQNTIEDANNRVCSTNLRALEVALEIYAMEHDTMPANLSKLPPENLKKAFASILQEKGAWKIKLAYFIVGLRERGLAYAGLKTDDLARGNPAMLVCPANKAGGCSYGLNATLANISYRNFQALGDDVVLVADCASSTFQDETALTERHKHYKILGTTTNYALGALKSKLKAEIEGGKIKKKVSFGKSKP